MMFCVAQLSYAYVFTRLMLYLHVYCTPFVYVCSSVSFLATLVRDLFDHFSGQVPRQRPPRPLGGPPSGLPRRGQIMIIDTLLFCKVAFSFGNLWKPE